MIELRGIARIAVLTLLLVSCASLLASCTSDYETMIGDHPVFREASLTGDPDVISRFLGTWYDYDYAAMVQVRRSRLLVRVGADYWMREAWTEDDEIRVIFENRRYAREQRLVLTEDEALVILGPGQEPSWCGTCTPYYGRLELRDYVHLPVARASQLLYRARHTIDGFLADL